MNAMAARVDDCFSGQFSSPTQRGFPVRQYLTGNELGLTQRVVPNTPAFSDESSLSWLMSACEKLNELVELPENWDGHNGAQIERDIAGFALSLLLQTLKSDAPSPQIVPLNNGGLQMEWHQNGIDLEVEVEAPNRVFVSYEDRNTGEELDKEFSTDYSELTRILNTLAS